MLRWLASAVNALEVAQCYSERGASMVSRQMTTRVLHADLQVHILRRDFAETLTSPYNTSRTRQYALRPVSSQVAAGASRAHTIRRHRSTPCADGTNI